MPVTFRSPGSFQRRVIHSHPTGYDESTYDARKWRERGARWRCRMVSVLAVGFNRVAIARPWPYEAMGRRRRTTSLRSALAVVRPVPGPVRGARAVNTMNFRDHRASRDPFWQLKIRDCLASGHRTTTSTSSWLGRCDRWRPRRTPKGRPSKGGSASIRSCSAPSPAEARPVARTTASLAVLIDNL